MLNKIFVCLSVMSAPKKRTGRSRVHLA